MTWLNFFQLIVNTVSVTLLLIGVYHARCSKVGVAISVVLTGLLTAAALTLSAYDTMGLILIASMVENALFPVLIIRGIPARTRLYYGLLYIGLCDTLFSLINWAVYACGFAENVAEAIRLSTHAVLLVVLLILCIRIYKQGALRSFMHAFSEMPGYVKFLLLLSVWGVSLLSTFLAFSIRLENAAPMYAFIQATSAVVLLCVLVTCIALVSNTLSRNFYMAMSDQLEKQVEAQLAHYEALHDAETETRRFRHDYKNQLIALQAMLQAGDVKAAQNYINEHQLALNEMTAPFRSGSYIADALLSEKQHRAAAAHATISLEGSMPADSLAPADICVLLGNLLDNAIESCAALPASIPAAITVTLRCRQQFLFLTVTNPVYTAPVITNNKIRTRKADKQSHGFGLTSVEQIAQKYDGALTLSAENNLFTAEVALTCKPDHSPLPIVQPAASTI